MAKTHERGLGRLGVSLWVLAVVLVVVGVVAGLGVRSDVKAIPGLFKRSAALKAQGYYTGEFEFKGLSVVYYLNEGSYLKAVTTLHRLRSEMENARLPKMPNQASPQEMITFLLDRQDPETGAFMDPRYPFFSKIAPTLNVVDALDDLYSKVGQPVKLRYPLRFLDEIKSPERLRAYLDSLLYLNSRWAGMGPGPYISGVSELPYFDELERSGVYRFSDQWKDTLRSWFYETQDPATGMWGARVGTPNRWRQKVDMGSTFHILHLVLDDVGNNQSSKYPLRYGDRLARTLLKSLEEPLPKEPSAQHGWNLEHSQGARMVTKLWDHLSEPARKDARYAMQGYITERYQNFFKPSDGGFSLYSKSTHSDIDGISTSLSLLRATGCLPGTWERERLWGQAISTAPTPVRKEVSTWEEAAIPAQGALHSLRVYEKGFPLKDGFDDANLLEIVYVPNAPALDLMDLRQKVAGFLATTKQNYGNWATKEALLHEPLGLDRKIKTIPVSRNGLDLAKMAKDRPGTHTFYVVGYDIFQVPVVRVEFVRRQG